MTNTKSAIKASKLVTHFVCIIGAGGIEGERKSIGHARRFARSLQKQGFATYIMASYLTLDGLSSWCQIVE